MSNPVCRLHYAESSESSKTFKFETVSQSSVFRHPELRIPSRPDQFQRTQEFEVDSQNVINEIGKESVYLIVVNGLTLVAIGGREVSVIM